MRRTVKYTNLTSENLVPFKGNVSTRLFEHGGGLYPEIFNLVRASFRADKIHVGKVTYLFVHCNDFRNAAIRKSEQNRCIRKCIPMSYARRVTTAHWKYCLFVLIEIQSLVISSSVCRSSPRIARDILES